MGTKHVVLIGRAQPISRPAVPLLAMDGIDRWMSADGTRGADVPVRVSRPDLPSHPSCALAGLHRPWERRHQHRATSSCRLPPAGS